MSKFEKYEDVFSFDRTLNEDDYNDGQKFVIKDKRKAAGQEFSTSLKIGEKKEDAHKVSFEEKMKLRWEELGGVSSELKLKNNGTIPWESQWDCI